MVDDTAPWPRKGDQLFKADVDWWHNACLNYLYDQWGLYAQGYKRAGDLLVEQIKETHSDQDILVFPIVFGDCKTFGTGSRLVPTWLSMSLLESIPLLVEIRPLLLSDRYAA